MADFEGEEGLSDEELAQINAHVHYNSQMQQQLASMASLYQGHMPHGENVSLNPDNPVVICTFSQGLSVCLHSPQNHFSVLFLNYKTIHCNIISVVVRLTE